MNDVQLKQSYNASGHSFSGYFGGKSQLARSIIEMMPEHTTYAEVFGGAGWVLFKKTPSKVELINDVNGDLVSLYRVVKYHFEAFLIEFESQLVSRDEYDRLKQTPSHLLTDIQRAARFYYLLRLSYGAMIGKQHFTSGIQRTTRLKLGKALREHLMSVHERLQQVTIENQDFGRFIERVDSPTTLFYVDPPYYGCETDYGKNVFSRDDFVRLREQLKDIQGKFILSLNDLPAVRELFGCFNLIEKEVRWSVRGCSSDSKDKELLITNF